jgi:hypothetical protein
LDFGEELSSALNVVEVTVRVELEGFFAVGLFYAVDGWMLLWMKLDGRTG